MTAAIAGPSGARRFGRRVLDVLWWSAMVLIGGLLAVHFTLVLIANLPVSPLRAEYRNQIEFWVHPWFSQNWSFFAPEPISEDVDLLVRGRSVERGAVTTTAWMDVNQPLIDEVRHNRFSALFVVEMTLSNLLNTYDNELKKDPRAVVTINGQRRPRLSIPAAADPYDEGMLGRFGSAALEVRYPQRHFTQFQIAIGHHRFARFNGRYDHRGDRWYAQHVGWQPFQQVATFSGSTGMTP